MISFILVCLAVTDTGLRGVEMQSLKEIMQQLGFNENAPESTTKALLKNLNRCDSTKDRKQLEKVRRSINNENTHDTQMAFDLEKIG